MNFQRSKKTAAVQEISGMLSSNNLIAVLNYDKVTFDKITNFRAQLRPLNANVKFVKNSLAKIAVDHSKVGLECDFTGSTCIVFGNDVIDVARAIKHFIKSAESVEPVAVFYEGTNYAGDKIVEFASIPSLDISRAQIAGIISNNIASLARAINSPVSAISRIIKNINK